MKKMNRKARRYLLTFAPEATAHGYRINGDYVGGRWAIQTNHYREFGTVTEAAFFPDAKSRDAWVRFRREKRAAVGKRNPHVKAFRNRMVEGRTA